MPQISNRPLHFIWICDCSGSMSVNGKIQILNNAIRSTIPLMIETAAENPHAQIMVRALTFSDGAQWHVAQPTPVESFEWQDLSAGGLTDMGKALTMIAEQLKTPPMENRALPPILVLLSDGQPTDDFNSGLNNLMDLPWGKKAVRIAISIGEDADDEVLQKFIGHSELKPLQAKTAEQLVDRIKWVSTAVVGAVSQPKSQFENLNGGNNPIPIPVPPTHITSADDVF
jgi:uncharacterized protein YegL